MALGEVADLATASRGETTGRGGRVYAGLSPAERDARRTLAVLDAGLELFGTRGYAVTTMTEVAELAEVPFRYLGGLFADKARLMEAVFLRVQDQVLDAVAAMRTRAPPGLTAQIRAGLRAAFDAYTDDPRRMRISCLEVVGVSQRCEALRRRTGRRFVDQLVSGLASAAQAGEALPDGYQLLGVGLVGAVDALLIDWVASDPQTRPPREAVIEASCLIYLRTLRLPEQAG